MGGRTGKALSVTRCVARISMLLVKLGGSVLTEKARLRTPRRAAIRRLAAELASVRQPLLIVHGAGSYGHILASRHRLKDGGSTSAKRAAAARVQADVRDVDGLFNADPKRRPKAELLETVTPKDLAKIEFSSPRRTDVTGSIEGKVRRMFEIAEHVDVCMIVNGNVKNRVRDALRGKRVVGTRIVRGP